MNYMMFRILFPLLRQKLQDYDLEPPTSKHFQLALNSPLTDLSFIKRKVLDIDFYD